MTTEATSNATIDKDLNLHSNNFIWPKILVRKDVKYISMARGYLDLGYTNNSPWAGYAHRAPPPPPETSLTGIFLFSRVSWIRKKMLTENK